MNDKIEIQLSKKKLFISLIIGIGFVLASLFFLFKPEYFVNSLITSLNVVRIIGVVSVLFFGVCSIYIYRKIYDKSPGLIIDSSGVYDNSNATSVGLIKWSDVLEIIDKKVVSERVILIKVNDGDNYIDKSSSKWVRRMMVINQKTYGTPISITANSLDITHDTLITSLNNYYTAYKGKEGQSLST